MSPTVAKIPRAKSTGKSSASNAMADAKKSARAVASKQSGRAGDHPAPVRSEAVAKTRSRAPQKSAAPMEAHNDASAHIDARIKALADWRGDVLGRIRELIRQAIPNVVEEWKWRGVPVWSYAGIICTGESYKDVVKTTFAKGASVADPAGLFNASLDGTTRRAIDFRQGDKIDASAFKALVRAAARVNEETRSRAGAGPAASKGKHS